MDDKGKHNPKRRKQDESNKGIAFISYSTKDEDFALDLYDSLKIEVPCFLASEDITGSTNWITELTTQLNRSWLLILLLTPNSVNSKYVLREINIAVSKDIPIYPIQLKPTELSKEIEFLICTHHINDCSKNPWPEPIERILKDIQSLYYSKDTKKPSQDQIQSRDRKILIDKNKLPPFVQVFDWLEADLPNKVETAVKSLPFPDPLEENVNPEIWIENFIQPFEDLLNFEEVKDWFVKHFEKLAFGQRGLTSFVLFDAVLSVPPLKSTFNTFIKQLEQTWKTMIFASTGTGKSRLLTYMAHYWRKFRDRPVLFIDHPQGVTQEQWQSWFKVLSKISLL